MILGQSAIFAAIMKKVPGFRHGDVADMTDDQQMHLMGIDLDDLYGSPDKVAGPMATRRKWFEMFDGIVETLGIEKNQLFAWPRRWLSVELGKSGPFNRGMMLAALVDYAKANK